MSKIHGMMDVGKRSMMNSQTALATTGHNIANKGTEGFSRQRVDMQTSPAVTMGGLRIGTGSRAAEVTRTNNQFLEKQIGREQAGLGFHESRAGSLQRVEEVFNEQNNKSLNHYTIEFFNSFREFANNPESLATRTQVKESSEALTREFRRVSQALKDIQVDIDNQIKTNVEDINLMSKEIASLNEKISSIEIDTRVKANDERDRRDLLLKKLGEKVNIRWTEGREGSVTITAGNSALLVAGFEAKRLEATPTAESEKKNESNVEVFYLNSDRSEPVNITPQLSGGALGGLLEVRDRVINGLLGRVDELAVGIATEVNDVHRQGVDAYNQRGTDFFDLSGPVRHSADRIRLNEAVAKDVARIANAGAFDAPGDNRIANRIQSLQYEKILAGDTASFDEFYNSMVGEIGVQSKRATSAFNSQKDIVKQLSNIRESISGVSLDEETTKMIEYQKAFDASARLIRTADEMFDTVLAMKR
jgi:flagellar hook-associated protein 1 FlgK